MNKCFHLRTHRLVLLYSQLSDCWCYVFSFSISIVYLVFQVWSHFSVSQLPDGHLSGWSQYSLAFGGPCLGDPSSLVGLDPHQPESLEKELSSLMRGSLVSCISTHRLHFFPPAAYQAATNPEPPNNTDGFIMSPVQGAMSWVLCSGSLPVGIQVLVGAVTHQRLHRGKVHSRPPQVIRSHLFAPV